MGRRVCVAQFYGRAYCGLTLNLGGGIVLIGMFNFRYQRLGY
jgi:hypothetical protein